MRFMVETELRDRAISIPTYTRYETKGVQEDVPHPSATEEQ